MPSTRLTTSDTAGFGWHCQLSRLRSRHVAQTPESINSSLSGPLDSASQLLDAEHALEESFAGMGYIESSGI